MKICMAGSLLTNVHCPMAVSLLKLFTERSGYLTAYAIGSGGREIWNRMNRVTHSMWQYTLYIPFLRNAGITKCVFQLGSLGVSWTFNHGTRMKYRSSTLSGSSHWSMTWLPLFSEINLVFSRRWELTRPSLLKGVWMIHVQFCTLSDHTSSSPAPVSYRQVE